MKEATSIKKQVQITTNEDGMSALTLRNSKVEVSADGKKVTAYTNGGVETKAAATAEAAAEGAKISISKNFNAVVLNGVTTEQAADGHLIITAPGGTVINKPVAANAAAAFAQMHNTSAPPLPAGTSMPWNV